VTNGDADASPYFFVRWGRGCDSVQADCLWALAHIEAKRHEKAGVFPVL
jgi:hypothetical protein